MVNDIKTQNNNSAVIVPHTLTALINGDCNLRCRKCYLGEKEDLKGTYISEKTLNWMQDAFRLGGIERIVIAGTEPFMDRKTTEITKSIAETARDYSIQTAVITNGVGVNKNLDSDLADLIENFDISLDGDEEIHNYIRGKNGYDATINGIDKIRNQFNRPCQLLFTARQGNASSVEKLDRFANSIISNPILGGLILNVSNLFEYDQNQNEGISLEDLFRNFSQSMFFTNEDLRKSVRFQVDEVTCGIEKINDAYKLGEKFGIQSENIDGVNILQQDNIGRLHWDGTYMLSKHSVDPSQYSKLGVSTFFMTPIEAFNHTYRKEGYIN